MAPRALYGLSLLISATTFLVALAQTDEDEFRSNNMTSFSRVNKPDCTKENDIWNALLLEYNRNILPGGGTVIVKTEAWIQDIINVSEKTGEFEIILYLNEIWHDPRLSFQSLKPCKRNLTMHNDATELIWKPNIAFINSKSMEIMRSPQPNVFGLLYDNGTVWINQRLRIIGPCAANAGAVAGPTGPTFNCHLSLESYTYNADEVKVRWFTQKPLLVLKDISLPDYALTNMEASRVTVMYPAGWWDELTMTFSFRGMYGLSIIKFYIPTCLMVLLSMASLALHGQICTRIVLNAALLIGLLMASGLPTTLRNGYPKASDIWSVTFILFIGAVILETVVVGSIYYIIRCDAASTTQQTNGPGNTSPGSGKSLLVPSFRIGDNRSMKIEKLLRMIDYGLLVLCALFFIIFTIMYWNNGIYG